MLGIVTSSDGAGRSANRTVRRLVGVYNADGTVLGELAYFVAARFGRAHCALCNITHGRVRERREWQDVRRRLPVRFDTYHRNDQPEALGQIYATPPIVAAETDDGFVVLLGPTELQACDGSTAKLATACERALDRAGLCWPQRPGT
jgi:hypothetical protein